MISAPLTKMITTTTPREFQPAVVEGIYAQFLQEKERGGTGGHLKPVTLKPVSHIFCVFVSAFSTFCSVKSLQTLVFFSGVRRDVPHFPHFLRIGFESLISKIRPTGSIMTGGRAPKYRTKGVRAIDARNLQQEKTAHMLQKPVFALRAASG